MPWMQSWLTMLREAIGEGRRFARVRVVSVPLTDYSRFGVWCAQFTGGAGEDIRYLRTRPGRARSAGPRLLAVRLVQAGADALR